MSRDEIAALADCVSILLADIAARKDGGALAVEDQPDDDANDRHADDEARPGDRASSPQPAAKVDDRHAAEDAQR